MDSSYIGPGMLFLNQYFSTIFNEYIVLWMCFVSNPKHFNLMYFNQIHKITLQT